MKAHNYLCCRALSGSAFFPLKEIVMLNFNPTPEDVDEIIDIFSGK